MTEQKTNKTALTSAAPFYTMNVWNSTAFSLLSGLYVLASLISCMIFGAPKVKSVPVKQRSNNQRKVAVITGSNTGIGLASARALVVEHGIDVVLACRSRDKAVKATEKINADAKNSKVMSRACFLQPCDLSSFDSIRKFAAALRNKFETIDILINNAGVNNTTEGRTEDDLELIFQSNVLGHFLLTQLIFDLFPDSGEGRVVTLSSVAHHFVDSRAQLDQKYWEQIARLDTTKSSILPTYLRSVFEDCMESYPPSKLATLLFAMELNRRFGPKSQKRIRAFSVNPGAVASDIWRSFPSFIQPFLKLLFLTTEQGCATSVAAAIGDFDDTDAIYLQPYWMPDIASHTAPFPVLEMMGPFAGVVPTQPRLPLDGGVLASQDLWNVCEQITGSKFGGGSHDENPKERMVN